MAELKEWALLYYGVAESPLGADAQTQADLVGFIDNELRALVGDAAGVRLGAHSSRGSAVNVFEKATPPKDVHCAYQIDYAKNVAGIDGLRQAMGRPRDVSYNPARIFGWPKRMQDFTAFLTWAARECPARRMVLVINGHSLGPAGLFGADDRNSADWDVSMMVRFMLTGLGPVSTGLKSMLGVNLQHFNAALSSMGTHDAVLLLKSCWMSTLEIASEISANAKYLVASQSTVSLAIEWPYGKFLRALHQSSDTRQVAIDIWTAINKTYPKGDPSRNGLRPPFSVVDLSRLDAVGTAVRALVTRLGRPGGNITATRFFDESLTGPYIGPTKESNRTGDMALMDVLRACTVLQQKNVCSAEARALETAVRNALVQPPHHPDDLCHGVSVFRFPPREMREQHPIDNFIWDAISEQDYQRTQFNRMTVDGGIDYFRAVGFEHK